MAVVDELDKVIEAFDGSAEPSSVRPMRAAETFDQYYRRDYRKLLGLAFVLTGSQGPAEDLCQEALTEAHRKWSKISGYDRPDAWVRRVMVNKSSSRARKLRSEARAMLRVGTRAAVVAEPNERTLEVWEAVRQLPERQAQAIALHYWDDLPRADIADVLGCSAETVKTHLQRGRASLADQLEAFNPTEGGTRNE